MTLWVSRRRAATGCLRKALDSDLPCRPATLRRRTARELLSHSGPSPASDRERCQNPLDELRRVVEQDGATFVVALTPSKEEIFAHPDEVGHLRLVNEVRDHLDNLGMEVLDLYPAIREVSETTAPFYPHDIHYNEAGNEAIGGAIAEWIVDAEILRLSSPMPP